MRKLPLIALLFIAGCGVSFPTNGPVHWHATVEITVCGNLVDLPRIPAGQGHLGTGVLHTHDDNVIHVEGAVQRPEDITVGRFFRNIGLDVTATSVSEYGKTKSCDTSRTEGSAAPENATRSLGDSGKLTAYVNGEETPDFLDHSIRDGDVIQLMYG